MQLLRPQYSQHLIPLPQALRGPFACGARESTRAALTLQAIDVAGITTYHRYRRRGVEIVIERCSQTRLGLLTERLQLRKRLLLVAGIRSGRKPLHIHTKLP